MVGAPIGFALLVPRVCAACKRSDPPCSLQPFQPLAEDAMLCQDCMRRSEFRTITKTRAIEEYGVTEEVLAKLRYMTKKSRQGYMMKLYLEKQVAEHGTRRGGGSDVCVQARIDEMLAPHKKQKLSEGIVEEQQEARGREEGNEFPSASNLATSPDMVRKKMELLYRGSSHGKRMQQASDPLAETLACCLPEELLIRTDVLSSRPGWSAKGEGGGGGFILYVMQTAMRMEENHALEVATRVANACLLPVFVVLPLISDDVIANERRWTFILQGVPEIQEALRCKLGIMSHVLVDGYRGCDAMADLISLSKRASCVVQEDMPVLPYRRWADELAAHASVLLVDTACVLPMKEVGRAYASASSFRSATANRRQEYMGRRLQTSAPSCKLFVPEGLEPLCLSSSSSSSSWWALDIVRESSRVDLSVPAVEHSRGGEQAAGSRWKSYLRSGLTSYARRRNNALDPEGVSRMSCFLHFGMLPVRRVACDANDKKASKFLDELLVWRELAYSFCKYSKVQGFSALPEWSRRTLKKHAHDAREREATEEKLEEGRTGDEFWDSMQQILVKQGELHNNLRMTWGKAILAWASDPERAVDIAQRLNDKYALDGADPCSVSGVLWCAGLFDGPKTPERKVMGTVRLRPTAVHARRVDAKALRRVYGLP